MSDSQILAEIAAGFDPEQDVATGTWFGRPCLKVGGKVLATLWGDGMAFKLTGKAHAEALQVEGAHLFDPRGQGHPLKEWVQIPAAQSSTWDRFARLACEYVAGAAQAKKDEIISALVAARKEILDAVSSLSPAEPFYPCFAPAGFGNPAVRLRIWQSAASKALLLNRDRL